MKTRQGPVAASDPPLPSGRVFLMAQTEGGSKTQKAQLLRLPHPRAFSRLVYYVIHGSSLLELNAYMPHKDKGSWFISDKVLTDGKMYAATPFDPYFLLLAHLVQSPTAETTYATASQLLRSDDCPQLTAALESLIPDLGLLCECKDGELWRLDQTRVLDWLQAKVDALAAMLRTQGEESDQRTEELMRVAADAVAGFQVTSRKKKRKRDADFTRFAIGLVGQYLPHPWKDLLATRVTGAPLPAAAKSKRSKTLESESAPSAQGKEDNAVVAPVEDYSQAIKRSSSSSSTTQLSAAQKRLAKTNLKGVKKLSSFFTPVSKK